MTVRKSIILNAQDIMKLYGITSKSTVAGWVKLGMPKISAGKFDLFKVHEWKRGRDEADSDSDNAKKSKEKYLKYHADLEEMKVKKAKEELIPLSKILPEWCARVGEIMQSLEGIAVKLPPLLEGKTQKQMYKILYDEVGRMRDSYARTGKYTPSYPVPAKKVAKKKVAKKATRKKSAK